MLVLHYLYHVTTLVVVWIEITVEDDIAGTLVRHHSRSGVD